MLVLQGLGIACRIVMDCVGADLRVGGNGVKAFDANIAQEVCTMPLLGVVV